MANSTCQDIVRRALRLVAGESGVPDGQEGADALEQLQSLILDQPGFIQNATWRATAVNAAYTAREGDAITVTAPGVVTLPLVVSGASGSRPPHDLAKVQILGDVENVGIWLFSRTRGTWAKADGLEMNDDFPFGPEHDAGMAAQLAVAMVDEYGGELSAATTNRAAQSKASIRALFKKFARSCEPCLGDYWE